MTETSEQFEGGAFSTVLEGGRSGAMVSLTGSAVIATTAEGQLLVVPYHGAELSIGGASSRMWFCRSADGETTIFCEAPGFEAALRGAAERELVARLDAITHERRHARQRYLWLSSGLLLLLAFVGLFAVYAVRHMGRVSVQMVPVALDRKLGKLALENMELGGQVSGDRVLNDAVKQVVERLGKAQRSQFRFETRVVESATVNAFALPGGSIVVYTGLLRDAASAEQLAGVLAHEMAHVTRRHGMQRIAQSLGVVAAIQLMFGDVSGVMAVAVELLQAGAINSYSREQEHEADMDAVGRMQAAHLEPRALADFFARLQAKGGELPGALVWFGTHPELKRRIRDVRARAEQLGERDTKPIALDWADVQRRAGGKLDKND